jgi:hypothetical protein
VSQRPVDEVREGGLDDRVVAVGDIRLGSRFGVIPEERVVASHREQGTQKRKPSFVGCSVMSVTQS